MAVHGRLEHDQRVLILGSEGQPIARTACGSVRFGGSAEVMQLRGGIELTGDLGPPGPPCPERSGAPPTGLTDVPDGWHTASRPADEREAFTAALFAEGAVLYTAEAAGCVRWTVEPGEFGPELARRWQDDTHRNRESIQVRRMGSAAVDFKGRWVEREPLFPEPIRMVSGRPFMPCLFTPVSIVDWDDDEVRLVRVQSQGAPAWAWPPGRPVERLFRHEAACLSHLGARLEVSARLPGAGACS